MHRRSRWPVSPRAAAAVGLALLATSAIAVAAIPGRGHRTHRARAVTNSAGQYRDAVGWTVRYPRDWHHETSSLVPAGAGEGWTEITFASFPLRSSGTGSNVTLAPPLDPSGTFPPGGVAIRMFLVDLPVWAAPDSRFPLALSNFRVSRSYAFSPGQYAKGLRPRQLDGSIVGDGVAYSASAFIGPTASSRTRETLERVSASVRFPRLHAGTLANGFYVLQPPDHYPVDSFTLVHPPDPYAPFYVVHAPGRLPAPYLTARCTPPGSCAPPGAFYGLAWKIETGGNAYTCKIRLDRRHDEFYCANSPARWNRVGAPIRIPPGSRYRDPLPMIPLKVAWDGQLIANETNGAGDLPPAAVRLLWPNWRPGG
jgi:hypothetical protein